MSPDPNIIRINFNGLDIYPVFIDYDMQAMKCRGLSSKIDLFSYGALTKEIEKLKGEDLTFAIDEGIFIRKKGLLFESGFFLFDFGYMFENLDKFVEKIRKMNLEAVYLENSRRFQMEDVTKALSFCNAYLLEFDDASHG